MGLVRVMVGVTALLALTFWGLDPSVLRAEVTPAEGLDVSIEEEVRSIDKARKAYIYVHSYERDPFESLIEEKISSDDNKEKPPLESYDIELMKVVAIILDSQNKGFASVKLPDDKYYNLVKGTRVGIHGGKVFEIRSDRVVIKQNVLNFRREQVEQTRELKLREEEEQ